MVKYSIVQKDDTLYFSAKNNFSMEINFKEKYLKMIGNEGMRMWLFEDIRMSYKSVVFALREESRLEYPTTQNDAFSLASIPSGIMVHNPYSGYVLGNVGSVGLGTTTPLNSGSVIGTTTPFNGEPGIFGLNSSASAGIGVISPTQKLYISGQNVFFISRSKKNNYELKERQLNIPSVVWDKLRKIMLLMNPEWVVNIKNYSFPIHPFSLCFINDDLNLLHVKEKDMKIINFEYNRSFVFLQTVDKDFFLFDSNISNPVSYRCNGIMPGPGIIRNGGSGFLSKKRTSRGRNQFVFIERTVYLRMLYFLERVELYKQLPVETIERCKSCSKAVTEAIDSMDLVFP